MGALGQGRMARDYGAGRGIGPVIGAEWVPLSWSVTEPILSPLGQSSMRPVGQPNRTDGFDLSVAEVLDKRHMQSWR